MRTLRILSPLIVAAGLVVATPALAQSAIGVNSAVRGSAQQRPSGGALAPARVRGAVRMGDQYLTGANSQVQVLLNDRSTFTVGANARMTVDRFVAGSGGGASVARGAFRFASGRTTRGPSRQAVSTPVASIGVRGTIIEGAVGPEVRALLASQPGVPVVGDDETLTLVVLRGPAGDARGFDTPGGADVTHGDSIVVLDRPGQAAFVSSTGIIGPFMLSDDASAALAGLLMPGAGGGADPGAGETEVSAALFTDDIIEFPDPRLPDSPVDVFEPGEGPDNRQTQPDPGPGPNPNPAPMG